MSESNKIHFKDIQIELHLNGELLTDDCTDVLIYDEEIYVYTGTVKKVAKIKGYFKNEIKFTYKFDIQGYKIPKALGDSVHIDLIPKTDNVTESLRKLFENE